MAKQLSQYMVVSLAENVTALCRVLPVCQSDHSNGPVDTAYNFEICLRDCMTSTPRGILGVSPGRMRLVSSWLMVLGKLICRKNKEQRGKRKFHEGEPHPNDRGGFTLYVWFPASWAPIFFFLHCRTSARHGRSTTGMSLWLRSNFPKERNQQPTQQNQQNKQHPHTSQGTGQAKQSGKFAN